MLECWKYHCPYCGSTAQTLLDLSQGEHEFIEDCPVCCRPIVFILRCDDGQWRLELRREDD